MSWLKTDSYTITVNDTFYHYLTPENTCQHMPAATASLFNTDLLTTKDSYSASLRIYTYINTSALNVTSRNWTGRKQET